jgi:hypothetical protein
MILDAIMRIREEGWREWRLTYHKILCNCKR